MIDEEKRERPTREALADSLRGRIEFDFPPTGAIVVLTLPRTSAASGLRT